MVSDREAWERSGQSWRGLIKGCLYLQDGRLAAGDQLLSVDGRSLVGLSQERYERFLCCLG